MKQIIKESYRKGIFGNRGYDSPEERKADMKALLQRGVNYFVFYRDSQAEIAVQYATCSWVTGDSIIARARKYGIYDLVQARQFNGPHCFSDILAYVDR